MAMRRIINRPRRGIGDVTIETISRYAADQQITFRDALANSSALGVGPKVTGAIRGLVAILDEVGATVDPPGGTPAPAADILTALLERTDFIASLRHTGDAQDEARAENVEELVSVAKEFTKNNPEGTLLDFLTEVSLVAAADELDDSSGTVSLMTLHTAKGLEYEAVFLTGVEEGLLPHQMSASEPGGIAEERRLFYVGITRARRKFYFSLAMTRSQFGEVNVAMPSRFLQEIPAELIDWRQSPGMANSRNGTQPRALNARRGGFGAELGSGSGSGYENDDSGPGAVARARAARNAAKPKTEWANRVTGTVRDNGDLTLAAGDRIRHVDFGDGRVTAVTGVGPKSVAEVQFDSVGRKRLLIKISPIEKI
jgi:DNA helicase-2/ATP-dependent DNA helicase PcrA